MRGAGRRAAGCLGAVGCLGALAGWAPGAGAQEDPGRATATRAVAAVRPETVRVGEAFLLGVTVRAPPGAEVRFPGILPPGEAVEQRGPVQVRRTAGPGEWRAYYSLLAWEPGVRELPAVEVVVSEEGAAGMLEVAPRAITVLSVLPEAAGDGLELRGARPLLERRAFPWRWFLLAGVALMALVAWAWRRGRRGAAPAPREGPERRALGELARLRAGWEAGWLDGAAFFDELEAVLRRYAEGTRGWDRGLPLRQLPDGDRDLARALRRSAWVRFGRLAVSHREPLRSLEACARWILADAGLPAGGPDGKRQEGGGSGPLARSRAGTGMPGAGKVPSEERR